MLQNVSQVLGLLFAGGMWAFHGAVALYLANVLSLKSVIQRKKSVVCQTEGLLDGSVKAEILVIII